MRSDLLAIKVLLITFTILFTGFNFANVTTQLYLNSSKLINLQGEQKHWFRLPENHKYHELQVTIPADGNTLYYPVIALHDQFKNVTRIIQAPIKLEQLGPYKYGMKLFVPFSPNDIYISLHTPQDLVGQKFKIDRTYSTVIPITSSGTTYYVSSVNNQNSVTYQITNNGFVEFTLPEENSFSPQAQQSDWFFDIGVNFGGDTISNNPGGDNYKAGGGALLMAGYDWSLPEFKNFSYQLSSGIRYQGAEVGEGENFGWVSRLVLDYDFGEWHISAGVHVDLLSYNKDEFGVKNEIDDVIAPIVSAEWEMMPWMNLTVTYMSAEFKDQTGVIYEGNQFGLGLKMFNTGF